MNRRAALLTILRESDNEINAICPAITPTLGAELLTDGGVETWASATNLTNWSEFISGTSTVNREGTIKAAGSYSVRLDIDASNNAAEIYQAMAVSAGDLIQVNFQIYASGAGKSGRVKLLSGATGLSRSPGAVWTPCVDVFRITAATSLEVINNLAASSSLYFDDLSVKKITQSTARTLLGSRASRPGNYQCTPTVEAGTQTGMEICYADADNLVRAIVNRRDGKAYLISMIGGTYAEVVSGAVTYGAAKILKVNIAANGTDFSLYYDGAQVGTTQTINMAGMGNQINGWNTYAGNTVGTVTTSP